VGFPVGIGGVQGGANANWLLHHIQHLFELKQQG